MTPIIGSDLQDIQFGQRVEVVLDDMTDTIMLPKLALSIDAAKFSTSKTGS